VMVPLASVHEMLPPASAVGEQANWDQPSQPTKYALSHCWRERSGPSWCTKGCCVLRPGALGTLAAQKKELLSRMCALHAFNSGEAATLSEWAGSPLQPVRTYMALTVAQQLLIRIDFRWFAGVSPQGMADLMAGDQLHPHTLTKFQHGRFCHHNVNWLHLKNAAYPDQMQKFAVLARSGEIAFIFAQSGDTSVEAEVAAKKQFESVTYITWENQGSLGRQGKSEEFFKDSSGYIMLEDHPFSWDTHREKCVAFYTEVVIGDVRPALIALIQALEGATIHLFAVMCFIISDLSW